ncbi:uncharacterized protein [Phaseolus vulgaris]|uniref:Uncharacterized protein n=1 Tax=Phaseolus vulgaris TaxID=3885 RepID=V7BDX8_PHAVU|nr:hypothetical protein PHAVU_007G046800g [Phaseolus vulgaris]ESW15128.1 hypothetical protein PHAVU_007G046800g [Phaseolus vulgaris]
MSSIGQTILMALTITLNKYASSNLQAVHRTRGKAPHTSTPNLSTKIELGRRGVVLSTLIATTQIPDSRTQLLQKYQKKSEENKEKNDKERLDSYYKRNYKDYFELMEGTLKRRDGELSDAEKDILEWLQKNK